MIQKTLHLVVRSALLAERLHRGQLYGTQPYFSAHLVTVAEQVDAEEIGEFLGKMAVAVAYLHDSIEDRHITEEELRRQLLNDDDLVVSVNLIADSVVALARNKDWETYTEYIRRLTQMPKGARRDVVLAVKRADLIVNLATGAKESISLMDRYQKALAAIEHAIDPNEAVMNPTPTCMKCPFCGSDANIDHDEMEQRAGIKASVQCLNLKCRAFGPDGDSASEAVEKWNSRQRVPISKRQLLCGWRGMAGGTGCVLPLGHSGGHGFSDGSGSGHRQARVDWLLAHSDLWESHLDDIDRHHSYPAGPLKSSIIARMKEDGMVAPTTTANDCRLWKWIEEAISQREARLAMPTHLTTFPTVFLANVHHAYAQTDGTYRWPNSREGDMLRQAKREIEELLQPRKINL